MNRHWIAFYISFGATSGDGETIKMHYGIVHLIAEELVVWNEMLQLHFCIANTFFLISTSPAESKCKRVKSCKNINISLHINIDYQLTGAWVKIFADDVSWVRWCSAIRRSRRICVVWSAEHGLLGKLCLSCNNFSEKNLKTVDVDK